MNPHLSCTLDANVFVAAARRVENHCAESRRLLATLLRSRASVYCPTLILPEVAAAIIRPTGDERLGVEAVRRLESMRGIHFIPLDHHMAELATDVAVRHRLRGADAVYMALAQDCGTTLVTWDKELLSRGPGVVPTMTPTEWLRSAVGR